MKKLIVIFVLLILAINICSQIDIKIRDDQKIIVVTKKGHVHWLWLIATFFVGLCVAAFTLGICGGAKIGDLDMRIICLRLQLDKKDNALSEAKRCLEKIQKEKANE